MASTEDPCWAATAVEKDLTDSCLNRGSLFEIIEDMDIIWVLKSIKIIKYYNLHHIIAYYNN